MPPELTKRLAGLPRWSWFVILGTGVALGLYLRHKRQLADDTAGSPGEDGAADPGSASSIYDSGDPSLAGAGFVAAPSAGLTPVESPVIPEGIPQIIGVLGDTITSLSADRTSVRIADPVPQSGVSGPSPTGGGPPAPAAPKTTLPAGYRSGSPLGHDFPGREVGWRELTGSGSHRSFLIRFADGHTEGWYYYTANNGPYKKGQWRKVS